MKIVPVCPLTKHLGRASLLILALCASLDMHGAQAPSATTPIPPDWALPGSSNHTQALPPEGFHRTSAISTRRSSWYEHFVLLEQFHYLPCIHDGRCFAAVCSPSVRHRANDGSENQARRKHNPQIIFRQMEFLRQFRVQIACLLIKNIPQPRTWDGRRVDK